MAPMGLVDIDGDPWLCEYEACEKLYREIAAQLSERDREIYNSDAYSLMSAKIRIRLKQLSTEIQQLRSKLNNMTREKSITMQESERRIRQVENLESSEKRLIQQFNRSNRVQQENRDRTNLLGSRSGTSQMFADMGSTSWGDDEPLLAGSGPVDVQAVQKTHQEIMQEQDRGLEELAKILSQQKQLARGIGAEVEVHNEILDDLADGIDRTTTGLINETRQIRVVDRKDRTCGYWVIIMLLFVSIVVVALVP